MQIPEETVPKVWYKKTVILWILIVVLFIVTVIFMFQRGIEYFFKLIPWIIISGITYFLIKHFLLDKREAFDSFKLLKHVQKAHYKNYGEILDINDGEVEQSPPGTDQFMINFWNAKRGPLGYRWDSKTKLTGIFSKRIGTTLYDEKKRDEESQLLREAIKSSRTEDELRKQFDSLGYTITGM